MSELQHEWQSLMLPNYGTPKVEISHGAGSWLWDSAGNKYLDMFAGIAVSVLGHGDERLATAIAEQARKHIL